MTFTKFVETENSLAKEARPIPEVLGEFADDGTLLDEKPGDGVFTVALKWRLNRANTVNELPQKKAFSACSRARGVSLPNADFDHFHSIALNGRTASGAVYGRAGDD